MRDLSLQLAQLAGAAPDAAETEDFARLARLRAELEASAEPVGDVFETQGGTGTSTVGAEARVASSPPRQARLLYRLVRELRPSKVVEFGAALGISGAHFACALARNGSGSLVSVEGSPSRRVIAARSIDSVAPGVATVIAGFFDDHLDQLDGAQAFFVDGNHFAEPTLRYVAEACTRMAAPAVMVLDDVRGYSTEMDELWRDLREDRRFAAVGDAESMGIVALGAVALPEASAFTKLRHAVTRSLPGRR